MLPIKKLIIAIAGIFAGLNLALIIFYSPLVPEQEWAQKIFYYHVPLAWNFFLAYFITMIYSLLYLKTRNEKYDISALAWAETGTLFCLLVLITGPIWATPIWGKPWTWEPRLTSTLVIFLIYLIYFMVREFSDTREKAMRFAAVISILAFVDVPIIYFAVDMWAPELQAHPARTTISESSEIIQRLFLFSLFSFTFLMLALAQFRENIENKIRMKNV